MRKLVGHQLFRLVGVGQQHVEIRRFIGIGKTQHDTVIGVHHLYFKGIIDRQALLQRHRPGRMHARTERRQDAHAPVTQLIAETFDGDRAVCRQTAGVLFLFREVVGEVVRGVAVQMCMLLQPLNRLGRGHGTDFADKGTERAPQFQRPPRTVTAPEGQPSGFARRRRHDNAIASDLFDAPGGRPEQDVFARAGFVHHLLIEFAEPCAIRPEGDRVVAAVRDCAGIHARNHRRAAARAQLVLVSVPRQQWSQVGEVLRWVVTAQHLEYGLQRVARQLVKRVGAGYHLLDVAAARRRVATDRDNLLGKHIERVARHADRLDLAFDHALCDHGAFEQVAAKLWKQPTDAELADLVTGSTDALQAARDRSR